MPLFLFEVRAHTVRLIAFRQAVMEPLRGSAGPGSGFRNPTPAHARRADITCIMSPSPCAVPFPLLADAPCALRTVYVLVHVVVERAAGRVLLQDVPRRYAVLWELPQPTLHVS